jgi:hypothetical protein
MAKNYDLRYLIAGTENLESYLLSSELYWQPGIRAGNQEPPYPSLTPGSLLLARKRAEIRVKEPAEKIELENCLSRFDQMTKLWRVAWQNKILLDFQARLRLWRDFLDEVREKPQANFDRYHYEVTRRVQLQLLQLQPVSLKTEELEMLAALDKRLRGLFKPGEFIWEKDLSEGFPFGLFWYLYGSLQE